MSITDELRECIETANRSFEDVRKPYNDREILHIPDEELQAIADRIDAEHKKAVERARMDGMDETFGNGWVKLPVDADGEVINIGDVMEKPDGYDGRLFAVDGMTLYGDHWTVQGFTPCKLHHNAPTVEDVLREFAVTCEDAVIEADIDALVAEYAAKLRLAGDAE